MASPGSIVSLEDVINWIHAHDGKIEQRWKEQGRINDSVSCTRSECQASFMLELRDIKRKTEELRTDLNAVRRTIYIAMGGVMVGGSILGVIITIASQKVATGL